MIVERIISIFIGYVFGLFTTGYFYSKYAKVDIRKMGSGNIGATNTLRTLGKKAGIIVFSGDILKGVLAVVIVWLIYKGSNPQGVKVLEAYAGFGAVLGHNFPVHLKFKGGKGIATTAGMMLAFCPWATPACLALFVASVAIKRYVSVGSMLVCLGFFVQTVIFGTNGTLGAPPQALAEIYVVVGAVCVLGVIRHAANIKRLLNGTENKV